MKFVWTKRIIFALVILCFLSHESEALRWGRSEPTTISIEQADESLRQLAAGDCGNLKGSDLILTEKEEWKLLDGSLEPKAEAIAFQLSQCYWSRVRPEYVVKSCTGALSWLSTVRTCIGRIEGSGARADFWQRFLAVHGFIFQLNLSKFSGYAASSLNLLSAQLSRTLDLQRNSLELALKERNEAEKLAKTSETLSNTWSRFVASVKPLQDLAQHSSDLANSVIQILDAAIEEDLRQERKALGTETLQDRWNELWATGTVDKGSFLGSLFTKNVHWTTAIWNMSLVWPLSSYLLPRLICTILCTFNPRHIGKCMDYLFMALAIFFLMFGYGSVAHCSSAAFYMLPISMIISFFFEWIPRKFRVRKTFERHHPYD